MRINKFIAENTEHSRRKADKLIEFGGISVNGKTANTGMDINPEKDTVKINGVPINPQKENKIYLALNKPAGYIVSRKDERGRKTIMSLIPNVPSLKPAGRLDKDTEGLLLVSNDGNFINKYTHPKFECEKEYTATVEGPLTKDESKKLESGIIIDGKITSKALIRITKTSPTETELIIIIKEGRKRQIRKMFDAVKHPVKYLKRLRIGRIELKSLKKGEFRNLTKEEIDAD